MQFAKRCLATQRVSSLAEGSRSICLKDFLDYLPFAGLLDDYEFEARTVEISSANLRDLEHDCLHIGVSPPSAGLTVRQSVDDILVFAQSRGEHFHSGWVS